VARTISAAQLRKMQAGRRRELRSRPKANARELRQIERQIDDIGKEHRRAKEIDRRVELLHELRRLGEERSRLIGTTRRSA